MGQLSNYTKTVFVNKTDTGASEAIRCDNDVKSLGWTGITTGTIHFEGSPNGSDWFSLGNSSSGNGILTATNGFSYLRANVTVATNVNITAWISY